MTMITMTYLLQLVRGVQHVCNILGGLFLSLFFKF